MPDPYWLVPAFFLTALTYAAAGFGGGSTYLALLALTALQVGELRFTALLCNLVVTGGTCLIAWREQLLVRSMLWPLVITSVPLAYLGGLIELPRRYFLTALALVLLTAALFMWRQGGVAKQSATPSHRGMSLVGGLLGLVSGILGIGGGILLSPWLFLRERITARHIAATTAFFIFVNSLAGLAGQLTAGQRPVWGLALPLMFTVFIGGQLGSRLALRRLPAFVIRRLAATLILLVALRLLWQQYL